MGPSIHIMYPVMYLHRIYSDMINQFVGQRFVSWSVYMRDDDGSVTVIKSAPTFEIVDINKDDDNNPFEDGKIHAFK